MLKLKTRMIEPQGGWVYRVPEIKLRFRAGTFNDLVQSVRSVMIHNEISVPENLIEIIEDQICRNTAKVFVANPDEGYVGMVTRSDMLEAVQRILKSTTSSESVPEHIDICIKCQFNIPVACIKCDGLDSYFREQLPAIRLLEEPKIHVCQIDAIPGIISLANDCRSVLSTSVKKCPYPDYCWKGKCQ